MVAVAATCRSCGRRDDEHSADASLQIYAQPFCGEVETGDPAIQIVGLHAEAARKPVRAAERLRGMEGDRDEIRHDAM